MTREVPAEKRISAPQFGHWAARALKVAESYGKPMRRRAKARDNRRVNTRAASVLPWILVVLLSAAVGALLARRGGDTARVSAAPVVTLVNNVLKLATVEIEVSDVLRVEEVKTFVIVDLPKSAILRVKGRVSGGFDLSRGSSVKADEAARRLRVTLPRASILSVDPVVEWFDEQSGWLNPITPGDRTRWLAWARLSVVAAARRAGIVSKSEERATVLVREAAAAYGWTAEVTFVDAPAPTPAP